MDTKCEKTWCVYEHVFPNGKRYIGITSQDPEKCWNNGYGYSSQNKMWNAIKKYGWKNIKHNVIVDGLTREKANALERYLIATIGAIEDGYNNATGGDCAHATYLNAYLLSMLNAERRFYPEISSENGFFKMIESDKSNESASEFWNEATNAVITKHREYSSSDELDVASFFFHLRQYYDLYCLLESGADTSNWQEGDYPCEHHE